MNTANYDLPLKDSWKFHLGEAKRFPKYTHSSIYGASKAGGSLGNIDTFLNRNYWEPVRIPHDWMTALPFDPGENSSGGYKKRGIGWYHIRFTLPETPIENARLVFEGVLGQTVVYVNGTVAARNFSGYNRFTCEIASYLLPGKENMIALSVDTTTWEAWSYEGAGLYRPVYIEFREAVHFDTYDCFVRGEERNGSLTATADLKISGLASEPSEALLLETTLIAPDGTLAAESIRPAQRELSLSLPAEGAKQWSPEEPNLYRFLCKLRRGEEILDTFRCSVGFRGFEWSKDEGMLLNGQPYRVKGICCHQDHGGVGAAVTPEIIEYRIARLKEFGINAYRCAHHAVPETLLDICDRLGMMVMVENRHFSVSSDALGQLESLVRLARNHPSVFLYSLFNEEPWQSERRGYLMAREMRALVRSLDSTRAVTGAMNGGISESQNAADALDVVGVNYFNERYSAYHELYPDKALLGTENCPTFATRGVYKSDQTAQVFNSYGDCHADFTLSLEETMESVEKHPFCAGCFVWSGFDSYGETNPYEYPSVMSHWGILDICGFAKDTAYLLAAYYKDDLFAHLLPHWNHTSGAEVRVCVFTNGDCAELFLNGKSMGELPVSRRRAEWLVPYEVGTIRVRVRRGEEEAEDEIRTAGAPARLAVEEVSPAGNEKNTTSAHIFNISVTDDCGTLLPDYGETVRFDVRGAEILGTANGNPNGTQPNKTTEIALFHGRAQVIASANTSDGQGGTITVSCSDLPSVTKILT